MASWWEGQSEVTAKWLRVYLEVEYILEVDRGDERITL